MPRDPRAWLADIVAGCDLLIEFTKGKAFSDYSGDPLLRSAVERQFEIVGEALRVPPLIDITKRTRSDGVDRNALTATALGAGDRLRSWLGPRNRRAPAKQE